MKNRVTKRLLSWFMSAVMIVGEFGGMPLSVNAQEDTLIEDETETEETVLDEEAVTEDGVASDAFEEVIINAEDDVVVVEEAKNDPRQAPWVEHPEWWSTWGSQLNYHDGKNTFEAEVKLPIGKIFDCKCLCKTVDKTVWMNGDNIIEVVNKESGQKVEINW